ncbi:hypothetical protein JCM11641_000365 [Rhodosporidiobolus odoratus]
MKSAYSTLPDLHDMPSYHGGRHREMDVELGLFDSKAPAPVLTLAWSGLTVTRPKRALPILADLNGSARSGEMLAVMGPSGAGKSTFLSAITKRSSAQGEVTVNGASNFSPRDLISFVEQDDALLGVLTVRETVSFAASLALGPGYPSIRDHVDGTLRSLGLWEIRNNMIGTPLQRGVSGGQKRRVTIACSVVAKPAILVLDEPTSGLDAASGREVVAFLRQLALEQNVLVVCTIHQPNYTTFSLFDKLLLLANGQAMYDGPTKELGGYLSSIGNPVPQFHNPADHAIDLVNTEFQQDPKGGVSSQERFDQMALAWQRFKLPPPVSPTRTQDDMSFLHKEKGGAMTSVRRTLTLMHRNTLNYSRNLLAYGIRLGMYIGMALLLALVWIHLGWSTNKLNDRFSVSFFSVAFLGFMSVAGIPAFLEERAVFIRERANGLYRPAEYLLALTIVSLPFLFVCATVFTLIIYWSIGMNPGADHFFRFLIYLFLALFAAESQSLLIAAAVPVFVAALALASFANGLWMCVQGYFIRATSLPKFWYYTFHFIDFQKYAFDLLVRNDFAGQTLDCPIVDGSCLCPIASSLTVEQCAVTGQDVLKDLDIAGVHEGLWVGILIVIIVVLRLAMWGVLVIRKK